MPSSSQAYIFDVKRSRKYTSEIKRENITIFWSEPETDCFYWTGDRSLPSYFNADSVNKVSQRWSEDLTDTTLAVKDANSKLVDIVAFADADIEEGVDNMLVAANSLATACHVWKQLDNSFSTVFVKT